MTINRTAIALLTFALIAASCGSDDSSSDDAAADTQAPVETEAAPVTDGPPETVVATDAPAEDSTDPESVPATISTSDTGGDDAAAGSTTIALTATDLGEFIVDGDGNSLYLFVPDSAGDSTCYDACEAAWPILGEVTDVGDGLDATLLSTTTRTNGDVQATYNGWPLYYFANDAAPGDVNGQGVGDVWYVVDAAGAGISS